MKNSKEIKAIKPIVAERRKFKHHNITYSYPIIWSDRPFNKAQSIFIIRKW